MGDDRRSNESDDNASGDRFNRVDQECTVDEMELLLVK